MEIHIEVRDYDSARDLNDNSSCAYSEIHYTGHGDSSRTYVREPDSDGDAYFATTNFGWWVGTQHAIKLTWVDGGEEVILKPDRNVKIKEDKSAQNKILDYLRRLIDNKFKYIPFGAPELKLELSGAEAEFMDI